MSPALLPSETLDAEIRSAAFAQLRQLVALHGALTNAQLSEGFVFDGHRLPWTNTPRGIFKPRQMRHLLSIKTVFPRGDRAARYDDQRQAFRAIYSGEELVEYSLMGSDPDAADNRWLRSAWQSQVPLIYFLGVAPSLYRAVMPVFIAGFDPVGLKVQVAFAEPDRPDARFPESPAERRYALRVVRQRLHQATFREAVIAAYGRRCALSGLPEARLLDAAHIVADTNERWGQPVISNGIPLSKIHHAAFDAHLIGIDPDYRLHVSQRLLEQNDGPLLEALKRQDGQRIHLPRRRDDYPDRDRLAERFDGFRSAA